MKTMMKTWMFAAANLSKGLSFDKNQSLTYQQVSEAVKNGLVGNEDDDW